MKLSYVLSLITVAFLAILSASAGLMLGDVDRIPMHWNLNGVPNDDTRCSQLGRHDHGSLAGCCANVWRPFDVVWDAWIASAGDFPKANRSVRSKRRPGYCSQMSRACPRTL